MLVSILVSYFLGSIPFGYLIVNAKTGADVRQSGSGGTGATNVSRRAGKAAGVLTLILDALKGTAAVILAQIILSGVDNAAWWIGMAGIVAMLGHIFPIWLGFRGGKGVATGVGVFAALSPLAVLCAGVLFIIIVWLTRYVSLASMIGAVSVPVFVWLQSLLRRGPNKLPIIVSTLVGATLIVYAHRANIGRLMSKTENKF
ncbi:MAG TPA: glycerol-3-phosphate 1-O-acyltransferase PlsY [Pyrinomonadaceae bacterium]|jgi:glycerol-3-phosphate acyltransferase PlsY|nr:glycerol-3-phosphate 1-O-acyltransferase PlsY [Pyrinomonadaceae bacterium]